MQKRTIELIAPRPDGNGYEIYHRATPKPVETKREPRPDWLKVRLPSGDNYFELKKLMRERGLHTVCEEANCPNIAECWSHRTATFLMLGKICTRACGFCDVTSGKPAEIDWTEPRQVADATKAMGLRHVVITSVNRDDREDGGAPVYAETVRLIHGEVPGCRVELLIPDFMGNWHNLATVMASRPEILNHNIESVPRLYYKVRPQAKYHRSLKLLQIAKQQGLTTKTGMMLGIGEEENEIDSVLDDLVAIGVDILTLGQYLQPTTGHLPVERWVHPDEFVLWKQRGEERGLRHVESGPMVRSSYHAEKQVHAHEAVG